MSKTIQVIMPFMLAICTLNAEAQTTIKGIISEGAIGIPFANIGIENSSNGVSADKNGFFIFQIDDPESTILNVTSVGYFKYRAKVDTLNGYPADLNIQLKASDLLLNQVVITGSMKQTFVKESPVKVEVLTSAFLSKIPTNNIVEAIQTVNGVQEQINCGVCGTNDIHINGMEGPYTLMLIDGMPIMSSLASVYGFNGIPTSLVEQIEIIKGPSSTLYGTEAVGGVINIITKSPESSPKVVINSYLSSHGEWNLDAGVTLSPSKNTFTTLGLNTYYNQYRFDNNKDNFTDIPLNRRITLYNKWEFVRKGSKKASVAFRLYAEDRFGGQMHWRNENKGSSEVYGETIQTNRWELIGSYPLLIASHSFKIDYSFTQHKQDSYYGSTHYKADQTVLFANFTWNKKFNKHDILVGSTIRNDQYKDNSLAESNENQWIPGFFIQDEWSLHRSTRLLSGVRFDYYKQHGIIFSPRLSVKQKVGLYTSIRLNLGTGFRRVNLFTEDHAALTGTRTVLIKEELRPERSYNANLNLNHVFIWGESTGTIDIDAFYTYFDNKIVPDYETDNQYIIYDNLSGYGVTKGFAVSFNQSFIFPLTIGLGGTFKNVYEVEVSTNSGSPVKIPQLFDPKFSSTFAMGYRIRPWNVSIDYLGKIIGPQSLPTYDPPNERPESSPWYSLHNIQVNKHFAFKFDIYIAVKNIGNWTQDSPLIAPEDPYGPNFDTAYAWGPLQTRRFLIGLKFTIE